MIWYKRPERGTWQLPATDTETLELEAQELAMILRGIDLLTEKPWVRRTLTTQQVEAIGLRPRGKESRKGKGFVQPLLLPFAQSQPTHSAEPVDGPQHPSKDLPKISVRFSRSLNRPIPDKPRSSRQRYRTMELGQQIRSQHIDN